MVTRVRLAKWGNSLAVRLPVECLQAAGLKDLAVALELGKPSLATGDRVLDANARRQGLTTIGF